MEYFNNAFGLILMLGILALLVVAILYFYQKKKLRRTVSQARLKPDAEVTESADQLVELNSDSLKAFLSPLRNDHPVFIHNVANLLERAKKRSDIKIIRIVTEQLDAQVDLLKKIDAYEEQFHILNRKKEDFKQRDKMQDLKHDRDKKRILNEIENLVDVAGGIEKVRKRELDSLEAKLTHENAMKSVRNKLTDIADREESSRKTAQLNDMNDVFRIQYEAIKNDKNLTPTVRKETLRTIEQTFIAQLDEFTRGL